MKIVHFLRSAKNVLTPKVEKSQVDMSEFRLYRSLFKWKLRREIKPNASSKYKIRYIKPIEDRVFTSSPIELHRPTCFRNYVNSDGKDEDEDDDAPAAKRAVTASPTEPPIGKPALVSRGNPPEYSDDESVVKFVAESVAESVAVAESVTESAPEVTTVFDIESLSEVVTTAVLPDSISIHPESSLDTDDEAPPPS